MKRLINYSSLLAVAALAWVLVTAFNPAPIEARGVFAAFAPGARTPVRFSAEDLSSLDGTALERRNQLRDWLLYTVVSDAGLDDEALSSVLYDLPPLRSGYTEPVSRFEYGRTRSRTIGTGEVIALVPRADAAQRLEDLADIADREYTTSGVRPSTLHVFEYDLQDGDDEAWISRVPDVTGAALFSPAYGYVDTEVRQASDLQQFLDRANDITSARFSNGHLVLGGRKVENGRYRGLTIEDVAALWQAERGARSVRDEFDAFDARWKRRTYTLEYERIALEQQRDEELKALKARLNQAGRSATDSTGFSLDPQFDFDRLQALVERARGLLEIAGRKKRDYSYDSVMAALRRRDPDPLLDTLYKARNDAGLAGEASHFLTAQLSQAKFQSARYDGALQGTEVGMVLFYTDLLAKLWALDFEYSAPSDRVEDFVPLLDVKLSPIYRRELEELPGTRLWFGPRDDGFHKIQDGILMARTATRVYAASSNTLKPGQEAEPNASSAAFLWWWNNHYDDVAVTERQYQRLNEIMKWGLVFGRMDAREFSQLAFLEQTKVTRDRWFPDWARRQKGLTFKAWQAVNFLPRGYRGTTTESLPLLRSRFENDKFLTGGVSLPSSRMLTERPALSEATDVLLRRPTVMEDTVSGSGRVLKGFDGLNYELKPGATAGNRLIEATPRPAARLRSADVEIRNERFTFAVNRDADALSVRVSHGDTRVGQFSVHRTGHGFETAFRNQDLERARMLLRVVDDATARGGDVAADIARVPGVEHVMPGRGKSTFYVRLESGGKRWLQIAPEPQPTVALGDGVDVRFASLRDSHDQRWTSRWVDEQAVHADRGAGDYVRLPPRRNTLDGIVAEPMTRGPPPGSQPLDVTVGSRSIKAWRATDGSTYLPKGDSDPWSAADALRASDEPAASVRELPASIRAGDLDAVARRLAADPVSAVASLQRSRRVLLEHAKYSIDAGQYREAASELDNLARLFPEDPQTRLMHAVALIGDNRAQSGVNVLQAGLGGGDLSAPAGFKEAFSHLTGVSERDLGNVATSMRSAELKAHLDAGPVKGEVAVRPDRTGSIRMEVRLLDWQAAAVSPHSVGNGRVYVEVGADFNPVVGVHQSVDAVLSDGSPVSRLKSWEIVSAAPDTIVDARTGVRYARVGLAAKTSMAMSTLTRQNCQQSAAPAPASGCGDDVYFVRRSATGSN